MDYFIDNFSDRLVRVAVVVSLTVIAAIVANRRERPVQRLRSRSASRVLTCGCAVAALVATTEPRLAPHVGLVFHWGLGRGGLFSWHRYLTELPGSIQSILFVGNVLVYLPVGFFGVLGWRDSRLAALLLGSCVPFFAEVVQGSFLRGVGEVDDVVLNEIGLAAGWCLGIAFLSLARFRPQARERSDGYRGSGTDKRSQESRSV